MSTTLLQRPIARYLPPSSSTGWQPDSLCCLADSCTWAWLEQEKSLLSHPVEVKREPCLTRPRCGGSSRTKTTSGARRCGGTTTRPFVSWPPSSASVTSASSPTMCVICSALLFCCCTTQPADTRLSWAVLSAARAADRAVPSHWALPPSRFFQPGYTRGHSSHVCTGGGGCKAHGTRGRGGPEAPGGQGGACRGGSRVA